MSIKRTIIDTLVGVGAGIAALVGSLVAFFLVGWFTGVLAERHAPEWWCITYEWLGHSFFFWGGAIAIYCGWRAARWYRKRHTWEPPYILFPPAQGRPFHFTLRTMFVVLTISAVVLGTAIWIIQYFQN